MACSRSVRVWLGLALFMLALSGATAQEDSPRFEPVDRLLGGRADWLSSFDDRVAFGSGRSVVLARRDPLLRVEAEIRLDRPIVEGVLSWNRLYLNDGRTIRELDLNAPVPLNDIETAFLCWAGAGITGMIAGDMPTNDVQGR